MPKRKRKPSIRRFKQPGTPPGALIAEPGAPQPDIRIMAFGPDSFEESQVANPDDIRTWVGTAPMIWVDVEGLGNAAVIGAIGRLFDVHPLAVEDSLTPHQRPKVDAYPNHIFVVARMVILTGEELQSEQVSMIVGNGFVLTFQEIPGDSFDPVRERLRKGDVRLRNAQSDHIAYSLLDAVVDGYYPVIEDLGFKLDELEDAIVETPHSEQIAPLHDIKRGLITIRRAIWPMREAIGHLARETTPFIQTETKLYFRDVYDHVIQVTDVVETNRERATDLMDVYLSSISNRINDVMRVLTLWATIFIPLTFIASIYGMNFDPEASPWNMPELRWKYGYPAVLGVMALVVAGVVWFFIRKGWFGRPSRPKGG
jgi:magnesium transporter